MQDQLAALEELVRIDLGFRQLEVEVEQFNRQLAEHRSDVEKIRELLEREKEQLAEAERMRAQAVTESQDIDERLVRSQKRQQTARNNKELDATTREIEVLRREREERNGRAAEIETAIGQMRTSIVKHEEDFARLQSELEGQETTIRDALTSIEKRRDEQNKLRGVVTVKIRADLLRKYDTIRERKGTAVAFVIDGVCRSCNVRLPPQLNMQLHGANRIHNCPSCQRILVLRTNQGAQTGA